MNPPDRGGGRRRTPLLRPGVHEGIDLELEHHVAERTERLIDEGWEPDAARREAERRFGVKRKWKNELVAEAATDTGRRWMTGIVDSLSQDVRYALRGAWRQPAFTFTLLATLALGIGATGGVFSAIDALLLRPLPYAEPEQLVDVRPFAGDEGFLLMDLDRENVEPWVEGADFLQGVGRYDRVSMLRTDGGTPTTVGAIVASANLDDVLGIELARGRGFVPEDVDEDRRVVILSAAYWRRTGADPDIVGTEIELDDASWTVVGVLAPGVKYPVTSTSDVWVPFAADGSVRGHASSRVGLVARLADGVSVEAAQERADALAGRLEEALPNGSGWRVQLGPVGERRANADTARGFWLLGGGVLLMLAIAVVNAINLLLVRGQGRLGEFGVRRALGASRGRVARQIVIEAVLLSLASGVFATVIAGGCAEMIGRLAPSDVTFFMVHEFGLERRALGVVFAVAAGVGLLVGVLPGLRLSTAGIAGSGPATSRGQDRTAARLRAVLVTGEIAISVVLLVGAGLFLRSFANMYRVDMGMATDEVVFATVSLPESRYAAAPERAAFMQDVLERLRGIPGVTAVAASNGAPPRGGGLRFATGMRSEDRTDPLGVEVLPMVDAGPGYLETLGTDLIAGRDLVAADRESDGVIIDRDLADLLFEGGSAVGRRFTFDGDAENVRWTTVVGVVEELALGGPDDREGGGAMIAAMNMSAPPAWQVYTVRTSGNPEDLLGPIRAAFQSIDDRLPLTALETGTNALGEALVRPRFIVLLFTVLAWLALVLSAIGIYGVVSYSVRQRRREMGIRLALGAPASTVRAGILRWGLTMAGIGTAIGLGLALQFDDAAQALLFGVEPGDGATLVTVVLLMIGVTTAACLLPAIRATRVDPVEALRSD